MPSGQIDRRCCLRAQRLEKFSAPPDALGLEPMVQFLVQLIESLRRALPALDVGKAEGVEFMEGRGCCGVRNLARRGWCWPTPPTLPHAADVAGSARVLRRAAASSR